MHVAAAMVFESYADAWMRQHCSAGLVIRAQLLHEMCRLRRRWQLPN
jgi:hypothetical protein